MSSFVSPAVLKVLGVTLLGFINTMSMLFFVVSRSFGDGLDVSVPPSSSCWTDTPSGEPPVLLIPQGLNTNASRTNLTASASPSGATVNCTDLLASTRLVDVPLDSILPFLLSGNWQTQRLGLHYPDTSYLMQLAFNIITTHVVLAISVYIHEFSYMYASLNLELSNPLYPFCSLRLLWVSVGINSDRRFCKQSCKQKLGPAAVIRFACFLLMYITMVVYFCFVVLGGISPRASAVVAIVYAVMAIFIATGSKDVAGAVAVGSAISECVWLFVYLVYVTYPTFSLHQEMSDQIECECSWRVTSAGRYHVTAQGVPLLAASIGLAYAWSRNFLASPKQKFTFWLSVQHYVPMKFFSQHGIPLNEAPMSHYSDWV